MNEPITRLFGLFVLLFALLIAFTSRWTVFEAEALRNKPSNRRALLAEERIKRGVVRAADGTALAGSERLPGDRYRRRYPLGELFGHPIGYSFTSIGRSGLELYRNDELTGREAELKSILDSLIGEDQVGLELRTTLQPRAQEAARTAMGSRRGGVVALDVQTGAVLAMWSAPPYDPNDLDDPRTFERLATDEARSPLVNRATQGLYPPGSTFKVVTASAALDSGRYDKEDRVNGDSGKRISGVPLENFGNADYGDVDLTTALTKSVNTVWAEIGEKLGRDTMGDYMERFGFYDQPDIDLPRDQVAVSGERSARGTGRVISPSSDQIDVGRMAIGQHTLLVTPLQMAMVAQTIANDGVRMHPYLTARVLDPDGRTVHEAEPERADRVMSAGTAREVADMMRNVVREGTGTAAALEGVEVAGKTGTAELNQTDLNQPWFIGFTDRFAVAVSVERIQGGTGGEIAAPIARAVLEALGE